MSFVSEIINNTFNESIDNSNIYETSKNENISEEEYSNISDNNEILKCHYCDGNVYSTMISNGKFCSYMCYNQFTDTDEYLEYLENLEALDELDRRHVNYEEYEYYEGFDELLNCKNCNKLTPHEYCCNECENNDSSEEEDNK